MIIKHQQDKTKFSGMSFYMENHITLGGSYIYNKKKVVLGNQPYESVLTLIL